MLERLLQLEQVLFELGQSGEATARCRAVILARRHEVLAEAILLGSLGCEGDAGTIHAYLLQVVLQPAGVILAGKLVGEIDHEARVAACSTPSDALRLEYNDALSGQELREPARGGKAGEAGADDDPVRFLLSLQDPRRRRLGQERIPTGAANVA